MTVKLTNIEKGMIAAIVICVITLAVSLSYLKSAMEPIRERGLKSVMDEVWNGKSDTSR